MSKGKFPGRPGVVLALAAVVIGGMFFLQRTDHRDEPRGEAAAGDGVPAGESMTSRRKKPAARPAALPSAGATTPAKLRGEIEGVLHALRQGRGSDVKQLLEQLAAALQNAPSAEARAAIEQFLAGGDDAPTERQFSVGEGGILESTTTLRVFLLDQLGRLERAAGTDSATASRDILNSKQSADEWAVALRNVAWSEKGSADFLAARFREMVTHPAWATAPTAGMLEAFDVAVYTRDTQSIPVLAHFLEQPRGSPLRRAATVALDRLSAAAPLEVMTALNNDPALLAEVPMIRADFYSKADLGQPLQRLAAEAYLARQDVSSGEKAKFLDGLFTPGEFVSDNLLTTSPKPTPNAAATRAAVVEGVARDWLTSHRFPQLDETLSILLDRATAN